MNIIKNNMRLIFFVIFLFVEMFFLNTFFYSFDAVWEYGMCHGFINGYLPYLDVNIVSTPLLIFLFSLGLFIKDTFIVFLLEFFILNVIVFYFVDKVYNEKSWFYILGISLMCFTSIVPNYNFLCFSLIVLLLCFEKMKYSDKLIGFLWGLLILSKHTIGLPIIFFVVIGLLFNKYGFKRILNRLIFMMIPLFIFFIYLLFTNSLFKFIDLSFMGLFDFASSNGKVSKLFYVSLGIFVLSVYYCLKNRNNIQWFYLLGSFMFVVPLFDLSHFSHYFIIFIIVFADYFIKSKFNYYPFVFTFTIIISLLFNVFTYKLHSNYSFSKINHFDYLLLDSKFQKQVAELNKKLSSYDNYYLIDGISMFYDVAFDRKITYFDVPLYGNYGYDGVNKMINLIKKEKDCYFVIRNNNDLYIDQFVIESVEYVKDNFKLVDSVGEFSIYYKE